MSIDPLFGKNIIVCHPALSSGCSWIKTTHNNLFRLSKTQLNRNSVLRLQLGLRKQSLICTNLTPRVGASDFCIKTLLSACSGWVWSPYAGSTNGGSVSCSLGVTGAGGRSGATDGGWQVYATWPEVFVYATHRAPAWFLLWEYKPGHKGRSVVIDRF